MIVFLTAIAFIYPCGCIFRGVVSELEPPSLRVREFHAFR